MTNLLFRRFALLLAAIEVACVAVHLVRNDRPFLIGDCPYYVAGTRSLLADGDWDVRNQLDGDLKDHEGFFALSHDGRIVPKHSVLLPILSCPFYFVAGNGGLLLLNLLMVFALVAGIARLAGGGPSGHLLALAGYLSSPLLAYTYNFSPDVLGAALLVWAYIFAVEGRPIACGLLVGLSVWAKVYLLLLAFPLSLIIVPHGWKPTLKCSFAAAAAVSPMLLIQWHLFASPLVTGYDRDARVTADGFAVTEHYSRFNQPVLTGFGRLLFDDGIGMLKTAPLWFLWPVGIAMAWGRANGPLRRKIVAMSLAILINLLFFARYDEWDASAFGNRFLFPALALGLALQGPIWRRLVERENRGALNR